MANYPFSAINETSLPQFQDWTDQYGMMQDNDHGETTGNGNLFTAHYVFGLYANGILEDREVARIKQVYANNFPEPGLLQRDPHSKSRQAQDDMFGLMGAEALACEGYGPITDWICGKVRGAVARDFGDFGQLLSAYYAKPQHPIVALCTGKY